MALIAELKSFLGSDAVLGKGSDLAGFVEDWRGRYRGAAACVVVPSNTDQVAAIVRACLHFGVPVLPQGGNTSLCGGAVPAAAGPPPVIVNLSRMRRIRSVDAVNNSIEVEAGCVLASVQQAAAKAGRLYAVSLGAEGSCQIGGNIATNAGGTGVLRYGNTRDNVLGLEVVLPDGNVWNGLYRLRKNNTGLDLKHLFIGSEGTMGIITAATLKLHPLPTTHAVAWIAVANPAAALEVLGLYQSACSAWLSAFEMINASQLQIVLDYVPGRRAPLPPSYQWHVLVELSGTGNEQALTEVMQMVLEQGSERGLIDNAVLASSGSQRAAMWEVRHSVSEGNKKAGVSLTSDSAVPVSAVPEFIERATTAVHAIAPGLSINLVAHLGDGNVHFIPFFTHAQWGVLADREVLGARIKHAVNEVAHALGGTFSAEHGIGQTLTAEMAQFKSAIELSMMRGIKQLFDPANLFNPSRLLPVSTQEPS
ncbi:hydroxyacid dehydrogenase [Acidovorax sp. SRB_14]|uniref:FAD-binding oxidoreductase n=1 Tax=Acidovorax sp. SRB_14 TaxID=1962699 RepID=UPI0015670B69|nr:FAD-binding oxidoreductase [Acidovorax sp. SRB_14]NMM82729.1 hydroxyacid dehydrogenase [Acidovorax sp. SRB_14]